jgi:hypothetical protein
MALLGEFQRHRDIVGGKAAVHVDVDLRRSVTAN